MFRFIAVTLSKVLLTMGTQSCIQARNGGLVRKHGSMSFDVLFIFILMLLQFVRAGS